MKRRERHVWHALVGGDDVCARCGVRRKRVLRLLSSIFGRGGETTYVRLGEVLKARPPCVDERQLGLFEVDPNDGGDQ